MGGGSKNLLADSPSPYLRQHADNPVHWRPWNADALAAAAKEDKPVLLSIGYAACHWCHVMAHESFEDRETAAVMNANFINIKVDREERPDLDRIYQAAHYLFARRGGGWPLTMFLTADGAPFFGGTYFPKHAGRGMPSFVSVLEKVAEAWREKRGEIDAQNARILPLLRSLDSHPDSGGEEMTAEPARDAARAFGEMFCPTHGGFRGAPKFPHPAEVAFCMREGAAENDKELLSAVHLTLQKMAASGLADHAGGGFFRYCVDESWTIPHFEKMLYDNGLLLALFADAFRVFDSPEFARAAEGIARWATDEMRGEGGGFHSSLDADSEGGEGAFYVWRDSEIRSLLTDAEFAAVESHFGLAAGANFEGRHHLARRQTIAQTAAALTVAPEECERTIAAALAKLKRARDSRPRPATDDKILTAWNGLMIRGLARAGRIMRRPQWIAAARDALHFVRRETAGGGLCAAWRGGRRGHRAFLDDYAFMLDAALELLRAEFCVDTFIFARDLAAQMRAEFEDAERGGFFFTAAGGEKLIRRPKTADDDAIPSGNGIAARALLELSPLFGDARTADAAEKTLRALYGAMRQRPAGCASLLSALRMYLSPPPTVLLYGDPAECGRWNEELQRAHPEVSVFVLPEDLSRLPEILQKPRPETGARGYVCAKFSCLPPADSLDALKTILDKGESGNASGV
ncbi:MAG: thioredoxin domain-containing protein [Gammaproteobacteria bacterium]